MLFTGVIYFTMLIVILIIGWALFRLSRGININITVNHKTEGPKLLAPAKPDSEKVELKEDFVPYWTLAAQAQLDPETLATMTKNANKPNEDYTTPISMDGVISEVNKVMGIEPIEQDEQKENK